MTSIMQIVGNVVVIATALVIVAGLYLLVWELFDVFVAWKKSRQQQRIARIEADLDRAQDELHQTILALAEQLAADRDEASRALTRAAYLSSGQVPPRR